MLLVVAIGIGLSYFTIGWVSNTVSTVSPELCKNCTADTDLAKRTTVFYRKDYFSSMITKPISYFDERENAVGLLTARLATDPAQLQQLLGANMAMALIAILSLIGCLVIAVCFNWRFALVIMASSVPIILASGWYRVRHEVKFEEKSSRVFGESARFATEAIEAIRTVASLTLESVVCDTYNELLRNHIADSWKKSRVSCLLFAASDSLVLLCMGFALW